MHATKKVRLDELSYFMLPRKREKKNVRSPLYKSTHDKRKSRREQEERIKDATELYNKKKKEEKKRKS